MPCPSRREERRSHGHISNDGHWRVPARRKAGVVELDIVVADGFRSAVTEERLVGDVVQPTCAGARADGWLAARQEGKGLFDRRRFCSGQTAR